MSLGRNRLRPGVRPDATGRYRIVGLPPGDYLLAAVSELQPDDFADPAFLEMLVPGSVKISLAEGEKETQDVMLAGAPFSRASFRRELSKAPVRSTTKLTKGTKENPTSGRGI